MNEHEHELTAPPAYARMSDAEANAEARRIIDTLYQPPPRPAVTHYQDPTTRPEFGDSAPIRQDDHRLVPAWAAGTAVAALGTGAGVTGIGCGAWLVLKGFASMTVTGVIAMSAPFIGLTLAALAIGIAVSRAKSGTAKHVYNGPVTRHTHIATHTRSTFSRTRNTFHS